MNEAVGLIEAVGLGAAIVAADACLKAAGVKLIGLERTDGAGMMTVKLRGDVGAVEVAIEVGVRAAQKVSPMVIGHVITRPAIRV